MEYNDTSVNYRFRLTNDFQAVYLDLAGHTISFSGHSQYYCLFYANAGQLTINDSVGTGKIICDMDCYYYGKNKGCSVFSSLAGSTESLVINGGTFESKQGDALCLKGKNVTINGGTFIGKTGGLNYVAQESAPVTDGTYLNINGGTFKSSDGTAFYIGYHKNLSVNIRNCTIENSMKFAGHISSIDYFGENTLITFSQDGSSKTCSPGEIQSTTCSSDNQIGISTPMYITDATFSVTTPRADEHPSMTALTNDYCIESAEVSWKNVTDNMSISADDIYERGHDYLLTLILTARDGWLFSRDANPSFKVYDYEMTLGSITDGGKKATCTYKYSIKADKPRITKQAVSQEITEGDSVTLQIEAQNATSYTWYYKSVKGLNICVSESGLYYEEGTDQTDTLKLNYFDYLHSGGRFYCCVEGPGGSIQSYDYIITVKPVNYKIWVGGTQVTSANKRQVCEGVRYSPYNNRLSLYNASVTGYNKDKDNSYEIYYDEMDRGEFLIKLEGNCSIGNTSIRGYGIRTGKTPLIIQGSGKEDKLTIHSGNGGIRSSDLTVKNCTLDITTEGNGDCITTSTDIENADVSLQAMSDKSESFAVDLGESSKNTLTIAGDSNFTALGGNQALRFNPGIGPSAIKYHAGASVKVGTAAESAKPVDNSNFWKAYLYYMNYKYVSIKSTKTPIDIAKIGVPLLSIDEAPPAPEPVTEQTYVSKYEWKLVNEDKTVSEIPVSKVERDKTYRLFVTLKIRDDYADEYGFASEMFAYANSSRIIDVSATDDTMTFEYNDYDVHAHDYAKKVEDTAHLKTPAVNCQQHGIYWYTCSICGKNAKDDTKATSKTFIGSTVGNHQMAKVWTTDATCHYHKCTVSGCNYTADKADHAYGNDNICDICGYTKAVKTNPPAATEPALTAGEKKTQSKLGLTAKGTKNILSFAKNNNISTSTLYVTEKTITTQKSENVSAAIYRILSARMTSTTSSKITLKWNKVKGADGYMIFGNKCGTKNKYKKIATFNNKKTSYSQSKLKKGTYYKYLVVAYKKVDGKKITIAVSKTIHATTTGGKYGNAKSVKLSKTKLTVKKGKSVTIKASEVKKNKKINTHRKIAFESSNTSVATVSSKGKVIGKKAGTCYIYVYAQNGIFAKVKITVKK